MKSKPTRKNAHAERIFSKRQNTDDFDYIKSHRGQVDGSNSEVLEEINVQNKGGSKC